MVQSRESAINEIKRKILSTFSSEEKIRIVLEVLRSEANISELCRVQVLNTYRNPYGEVEVYGEKEYINTYRIFYRNASLNDNKTNYKSAKIDRCLKEFIHRFRRLHGKY